MGYSREVYDAAIAELEQRRTDAKTKAAALHERMSKKYPRIREIEREMAGAAMRVARAVLDGGDVTAAVERIKSQNLKLQSELASVLAKDGVRRPNFEPNYSCPCCEDTGYSGGKACDCLKVLLREESFRRLSYMGAMKDAIFDDLRLSYYPDKPETPGGLSPRACMKEVFSYCKSYSEDFSADSPSLLLYGTTGTGKTHVSLAIARNAINAGFGVIYGPVQKLLHRLEKEHFGREVGNSEDLMTDCDLLILDDLGSEFLSQFYTSCLYNLINSRMLDGRPTIISTNLDQKELERYGEQITSRIIGTYIPLSFVGRDIRQIKLKENIKSGRA